MLLEERLGIAQLSFGRALREAQARSSPASWRRLLTASRNLESARRDHQRARGGPPGPSRPSPCRILRLHPRRVWRELLSEWERSKELMARAAELVRQSHELVARE